MRFRGLKWTNARILERIGERRIHSIELYDTAADDQLLEVLSNRGSLHNIDLASSEITDAGIGSLARGCELGSLMIRRAPLVTDRALNDISQCSSLAEL